MVSFTNPQSYLCTYIAYINNYNYITLKTNRIKLFKRKLSEQSIL